MKAEINFEWLICECGDQLREYVATGFSTMLVCMNEKCPNYKKKFGVPKIELQEIAE